MTSIWPVFGSTFLSILQIFIVAAAAGALVRTRLLAQAHIQGLSAATVVVFLPCMTFSNITGNFYVDRMPAWWVMPLAAVAMIALGLALALLAFARELPEKRNMLSLASLQNAGYLALPVGQALFPDRFDSEFSVYCFLFILGVNPLLWTVGKWLATSSHKEGFSWKSFVTPPFVATLVSLLVVFSGLRDAVPATMTEYVTGPAGKAVHLLGQATVPVATFVLGASLGSIEIRLRPYLFDTARVLLIKLFLLPLATILVARGFGLRADNGILGAFFVIQAAGAPATATILQVRAYGGDEQKIGSVLFVCYLFCAVAMPFWFAVWTALG